MNNVFSRLSCAVLATVLVSTGVGAASAAPDTPETTAVHSSTQDGLTAQVTETQGRIVSSVVEETTGELFELDATRTGPQLIDGVPNGGASMGQFAKDAGYPDRAAAAAAAAQEEGIAEASSLLGAAAFTPTWGTLGIDVSYYQGSAFDWSAAWDQGARFVYIKATEGNYYPSKTFPQSMFDAQWAGATQAGFLRGAYHFANPSMSSGADQADRFVAAGGGWSPDGRTLPGLLDLEDSPYDTDPCYGLTQTQMVSWIRDFSDRYKAHTGRAPAIYTGAYWWNDCTGYSTAFNDHPLHIASYGVDSPRAYPAGWSTYDLWQYTDNGISGGDSNVFHGSPTQLQSFATNPGYHPVGGTAPAPVAGPFTDVAADHGLVREITWVRDNGVLRGWADGTFRPNLTVPREQVAAVLYRLAGSPAHTPATVSPFADVPTSHVFYKEISWLRATGISGGWVSPDGVRTFKPSQAVTREAMAAFFYRAAGSPAHTAPSTSPFVDVTPTSVFYKEMTWMHAQAISRGWADGTYRPAAGTSRDVMAAFLQRFATRT